MFSRVETIVLWSVVLPSLVTEIGVVASRPRAINALAIAGALSAALITTIGIVGSKCNDQSIGSEPLRM